MIVLNVEQGSKEWHNARLGIPTASRFSQIITKTLKPSVSATGYMHELLGEWALGEPSSNFSSAFMERGISTEDEAINYYEFEQEEDTRKVGFCLRDDKLAGCSPDRLVGLNGGLEIKVPSAKIHIAYLLGSPVADYHAQVQGCLYITGREWWDILSFNPFMPPSLVRCQRDEAFITKLDGYLKIFLDKLSVEKEKLRAMQITGELENYDDFNEIFEGK